jgi:hypothetical protein
MPSKDDLYDAASEIGIDGRSSMSKAELHQALLSFIRDATIADLAPLSSGTLYRLTQIKDISGRGSMSSADKICALLSGLTDQQKEIIRMSTSDLTGLAKAWDVDGYSKLRKHELIVLLCEMASEHEPDVRFVEDPVDVDNDKVYVPLYNPDEEYEVFGYVPKRLEATVCRYERPRSMDDLAEMIESLQNWQDWRREAYNEVCQQPPRGSVVTLPCEPQPRDRDWHIYNIADHLGLNGEE